MGLAQAWELLAASLPHGAERRLGILRALAVRPRFLLLDEPAAGLNETETEGCWRRCSSCPVSSSSGCS
jgi:ABC-type branched-subunit amino acid transport system ATPase component